MGDCPNPCDFLIINVGGQNKIDIATNESMVRPRKKIFYVLKSEAFYN